MKTQVRHSITNSIRKKYKKYVSVSVEGRRLNEEWSSARPQACLCKGHEGCSQPICLNEDGVARSYDNVCEAMSGLVGKNATTVVAVGLGKCKALYSCKLDHYIFYFSA